MNLGPHSELSFEKEVAVYKLLEKKNISQLPRLRFSGYLLDANSQREGSYLKMKEEKPEPWRFPYLVVDMIDAQKIGDIYSDLSESNWDTLVDNLAEKLYEIHNVKCDESDLKNDLFKKDFANFIMQQRGNVLERQSKWGVLSSDLIQQIEEYLPTPENLPKRITVGNCDLLLHADLQEENILGVWKDENGNLFVDSESDSESESESDNNNNNNNNNNIQFNGWNHNHQFDVGVGELPTKRQRLNERNALNKLNANDNAKKQKKKKRDEAHWEISGIIDFGDARKGDFVYELVPLHISVFRCSSKLLGRFLRKYCDLSKVSIPSDFAYRAMCSTLLHTENAIRTAQFWKPNLKKAITLAELANELWKYE